MYPAADISKARDFYETILGLEVGNIFKHPNDGFWIEYDLPEGGCLAISNLDTGRTPSPNSGGAIAFEVEDLDIIIADLKSKDVQFKLEKFTTEMCSIAVILDPEGNAITLHQLKRK